MIPQRESEHKRDKVNRHPLQELLFMSNILIEIMTAPFRGQSDCHFQLSLWPDKSPVVGVD